MASFVVILDPKVLVNADTDLSLLVPEAIEKHSEGFVSEEGWAYADDLTMHLYFSCSDPVEGLEQIKRALSLGPIKQNNLSETVVGLRTLDSGKYTAVHPSEKIGMYIEDADA